MLYILIYYVLHIIYYVIYVCNKINTKRDHKFEREQRGEWEGLEGIKRMERKMVIIL